jgi:hypothetical protein
MKTNHDNESKIIVDSVLEEPELGFGQALGPEHDDLIRDGDGQLGAYL